jgi:hypothetical protein
MNIVSYQGQLSPYTVGRLPVGTVFHFKSGTELYVTTDSIAEGKVRVVQLKSGNAYLQSMDVEIVPLPEGARVSLEVNKRK